MVLNNNKKHGRRIEGRIETYNQNYYPQKATSFKNKKIIPS